MAEEDIESLSVSENIAMGKPNSSDKECANGESSGSVDSKECSKQNSTGKHSVTKKSEKVSPNYLRASTGSCHDLCKYGIKHGIEHEEKRPWRKKNTLSGKKNCVVTIALPERRKSMVIKSSLLQDEVSSGAVISPHHPPEIIKREITLPPKKSEASDKTTMVKKGKKMADFSEEKSPSAMKQTSYSNSVQSGQNTKKDEKRMNSSSKISSLAQSQQVKARLSSSVAGLQPAKARLSSSMQTGGSIKETIKSSKSIPNLSQHSIQAAGGLNDRNKKSEVKIREVNTKLSSSIQSARTVNEKGKRSDHIKTMNNTAAFSSAAKQRVASNRPSISRTTVIKPKKIGSLKVVAPFMDQNKMQKSEIRKTSEENVPEKTLHVVEVETKAKLTVSIEPEARDISPPLSLHLKCSLPAHEEVEVWGITPYSPRLNLSVKQHISPSAHEEVGEVKLEAGKGEEEDVEEEEKEQLHQEDEGGEGEEMETEEVSDDGEDDEYIDDSEEGEIINGNETVNYDDISAVEANHGKPLKKGYIVSDSRDSVQVKLKFRRGKVLDIQSENKGPRRLRFRRGRIVEESPPGSKNEANRRNFSRRDISEGNIDSTGDEKIVLRHQDLQGKKDAQGSLLNLVLEETASKLVETRKSKVKALVGAFETVISLHDSKPSAQPVA